MEITKDKNILMITVEDNKCYKIDLSTLTMYGVSGKVLKNLPKPLQDGSFRYRIEETLPCKLAVAVVRLKENFGVNERVLQSLSLFERFLAVGLQVDSATDIYRRFDMFSAIKLNGEFISFMKENFQGMVDMDTLLRYNMREFRNKYNLGERQFDMTYRIMQNCSGDMEMMEFIAINIIHKHIDMLDNWASYCQQFIQMSKEMERDWKKEKFIFDAYCRLKFEYEIWKNKTLNDRIAKKYNEKWLFEYEDCFVVIPKSVEDFKNEGDNNSNCVAGYAERHADGQTIVVFIRKKSNPEKSYITCQLDSDWDINQFRTSHNGYPDALGNRFQRAYHQHLMSVR